MQQEATTTESGALRFHHSQHSLGCDQGIHGMPTSREDGEGCLAGERIGRDHNGRPRCRGNALAAEIGWLRIVAAHWSCWSSNCCGADTNTEDQQQSTEHERKAEMGDRPPSLARETKHWIQRPKLWLVIHDSRR
jgi:hypothetical protein